MVRGTGLDGISARHSQSGLMPANFTTLAHFSVSSAMSFPKSAGEPGIGVPPRSANLALILGSARAALISLLSLSMISAGVFLGAPMPSQGAGFVARQKSPTVGMSGSASERASCGGYRQWRQLAGSDVSINPPMVPK